MSFSENTSDSDWKEAKIKVKSHNNSGSGKQKYSQKFCEKWLSLFDPWLRRSADDPNKPFCRACQCRLDCNRCHLERHERTTKHKRNLESLITKGEGAVRKELSVRQERSKYYLQRKRSLKEVKQEPVAIVQEIDNAEEVPAAVINTDVVAEESSLHIQSADVDTMQEHVKSNPMSVVQTSNADTNHTKIPLKSSPSVTNSASNRTSNKEGLKLLMQIQQDKNELMESFRELIGVQLPHPAPPKEKNHVDLFFESVSSSVKALSPKLIAEAKMRVLQLICELELRDLKDNSANGDVIGIVMPMTTPQSLVNQGTATGQHMSHHTHFPTLS